MTTMKTSIKILVSLLLVATLWIPANAQLIKGGYLNVDWQFNTPVGNDYANIASGWGMNFEGGYYIIPNMSVGLFMSFHTNNKYIGEQTLQLNDKETLYADQQHSIFQLPFGAAMRWRFTTDKMLEPYAAVKLGATYSRTESITQVYTYYDNQWGFNVQPEIGFSLFPMSYARIGIHMAVYYNYSTNKSKVLSYSVDGLNNIGFRLGISF